MVSCAAVTVNNMPGHKHKKPLYVQIYIYFYIDRWLAKTAQNWPKTEAFLCENAFLCSAFYSPFGFFIFCIFSPTDFVCFALKLFAAVFLIFVTVFFCIFLAALLNVLALFLFWYFFLPQSGFVFNGGSRVEKRGRREGQKGVAVPKKYVGQLSRSRMKVYL